MGYDMSDSLFMQQQEAAGRDKESKRALEERSALEAFRAAALQVSCPNNTPAIRPRGFLSATFRGSFFRVDCAMCLRSSQTARRRSFLNLQSVCRSRAPF